MIELLAEQLVLSLKKPLFRNYVYARKNGGSNVLHLIKPLTYMNRSGDILPSLMHRTGTENDALIVIVDNMDLPAGRVRMKANGSSAGHNGLKSIMANIETGQFYRLYIGVGRPEQGSTVVDHVLGEFSEENRKKVDAAIERCVAVFSRIGDMTIKQLAREINAGNS